MQTLIFDIECYTNYFLASFKRPGSDSVFEFELYDGCKLDKAKLSRVMGEYLTVGFNSLSYDLPMICAALKGWSNEQIKRLSDEIITSGDPSWQVCRRRGISIPNNWEHIDLIEVAPGKASLKIYGGRLHSGKLQDLPIEPSARISPAQRAQLRAYCINDLRTTEDLYNALRQQLALRASMGEQYGVNLMSKSDAQIAEAVLRHELEDQGVSVGKNPVPKSHSFAYNVPEFIRYNSPTLRAVLSDVLASRFSVKDNGQVQLPPAIDNAIEFDGAKYKMGIGGLHSQEKCQVIECGPDEMLFDADFASYYPFIILGEQYYPRHLGKGFLTVYRSIVERRIAAKNSGDMVTANSLKITINGSFGKLGSKYSFLYSPELLIQTTITGQLCLLMLIEMVTEAGGHVVSANTDGIVIRCPRSTYAAIGCAMFDFEMLSGYTLEETHYRGIYSRDVNNYVAVTTSGKTKGKGAYAKSGLMKNPTNAICTAAVHEYLSKGRDVAETIRACSDVRQFLSVRSVTGGAVWRDAYLGKAVRFYYSTDGDSIHYKKNGNKVPKSDGCRPLMDLPDALPSDLDLDWYIAEADKMLKELGC